MNLEKTLQNYGLNEKQAKIYLACLELGTAPVSKISQKSGILRSTSYEILKSLQEMGLISTFLKKKVKYFTAENPQKAIDIAKQKAKLLETAIPQLRALYGNAKTRPTVRFYQGEKQMKMIMEEVLKEAKELLSFGSASDLLSIMGDYWPKFVERRAKKKIPAKVILWESETAYERKKTGPAVLREVRIVPAKYKNHGLMFTWANKVAMFSFQKDLTALVIESEELANVQKTMFYYMWNTAGE